LGAQRSRKSTGQQRGGARLAGDFPMIAGGKQVIDRFKRWNNNIIGCLNT
jgi:hypothetical protein